MILEGENMLINIPGVPIAKKRPRFARRGGFVTTYNPQESEEGKWITLAMSQIKEKKPAHIPIVLNIIFVMPIPKSTSKKKADLMREGVIFHTKKPDLDNLIKFVKDCLNGIAWHDDSQVYKIWAEKRYGDNPETNISI
jgi:Holliday junction resolvase RusA-like endonuclease